MARFSGFDGLSLYYEDEGQGLPLLCLPGLTRTARDFDYLAPHLPPLRLIRTDYRGRGLSDWAPDPMSYTVPNEARDVLALLDHLGIGKAAILGTSRGGLVGMLLAATAKDRLLGLALNDIGPVPPERWLDEARHFFLDGGDRLTINYDPALREAFLAAFNSPPADLWPLFDACAGLPLALIRGANSDLLSRETAAEMRRRRPDMVFADVPDRAHVPFLDEAESLAAIRVWLALLAGGPA